MECVGLETTTSPSTSRVEGASGPLIIDQVPGDSAHMEVVDQSRGDPAVRTGVESAEESQETQDS